MTRAMPAADRFWKFVRKSAGDGCWEWTGAIDYRGYGRFAVEHKNRRAPRVAWLLTHGTMPARNIFVCHHCDNPKCVRPDHLFLGTAFANMRDMVAKGRSPDTGGENNPRCLLTRDLVAEIRRRNALGVSHPLIAKEFGVARTTITDICTGRRWKEAGR